MATIIAIILVLILMTVVIFFILKNTVSNINEQGRVYFTLKLQQYEKEYNSKTTNEGNKGLEENKERFIVAFQGGYFHFNFSESENGWIDILYFDFKHIE